MTSVTFDQLHDAPTRTIESVPLRLWVDVTHRGNTIARMVRPVTRAEIPDGIEVVQVADLRRGRDDRAQRLRAGERFAIGCHGRRIAVVEGIAPPKETA